MLAVVIAAREAKNPPKTTHIWIDDLWTLVTFIARRVPEQTLSRERLAFIQIGGSAATIECCGEGVLSDGLDLRRLPR